MALSISRQRSIFRCARVEYGSEGCGVTAAGIKGGAGQSTLEVGDVVAQPASNVASSSGSHLGGLGSFLCSIEGSYRLLGLAALFSAVGCGLHADQFQARVFLDRVLAGVPLDAGSTTGDEDTGRDQDLDQQGAHAMTSFALSHSARRSG